MVFLLKMTKVGLGAPAIITPWRRYCGEEHVGRPTLVPPRAVPARSRAAAGKDPEREGGRDGRAGDAPLDRASTTVGVWTRAVTSARLDRPHQLDGALVTAAAGELVAQPGQSPRQRGVGAGDVPGLPRIVRQV